MTDSARLWDSGERVPAERHNTLYLELLSAYEVARELIGPGVVLDVGCGAGYGADHLAKDGRRVIAVDDEPTVAAAAARRYQRRGLSFVCMDGMRLGLRSVSVDLACAFQVIEHLPEPERLVCELARVLRPSGLAILSTPNALTHLGPRNPFHVHEFATEELKALLGRHFAFVLVAGQRRPPEVYALEAACQQVRRRDRLGVRRLVPRGFVSLAVYAIARWNRLTPPHRLSLNSFQVSPQTDSAYNLFALCGHSPLPEMRLDSPADP